MKTSNLSRTVLALAFLPLLAAAEPCEKTALAQQYAKMRSDDQSLRGRYIHILEMEHRKEKFDPKEKDQLEYTISDIDESNQRNLDKLIGQCGWPGKLDANRAADAAFLIIQHADLDYQLKHADLLAAANKRGEIPNKIYAMFVDRVRLRQGKGQLYGTQQEYGSNKMPPIDDPRNLNQRRKTMGLPPLSTPAN